MVIDNFYDSLPTQTCFWGDLFTLKKNQEEILEGFKEMYYHQLLFFFSGRRPQASPHKWVSKGQINMMVHQLQWLNNSLEIYHVG